MDRLLPLRLPLPMSVVQSGYSWVDEVGPATQASSTRCFWNSTAPTGAQAAAEESDQSPPLRYTHLHGPS